MNAPAIGSSPCSQCFSGRCQPRGRTMSTAVFSLSRYALPSGVSCVSVRRTACIRFAWPSIRLAQVGHSESSKSAMKTFAPEFSALMTILRSGGPVISTRRSSRSAGIAPIFQSASRSACVSSGKSGNAPASNCRCSAARRASSSSRSCEKRSASSLTKPIASGVRTSPEAAGAPPRAVVVLEGSSGSTGNSLIFQCVQRRLP